MKEYKIGETFEYHEECTLGVVEDITQAGCNECYFRHEDCKNIPCGVNNRTDKKCVYYKKVEPVPIYDERYHAVIKASSGDVVRPHSSLTLEEQREDYVDGLKHDGGKLRFDLIEPSTEKALAEVFTFGQSKGYEERSWRNVEVKRYLAALKRHINEWQLGVEADEESRLNPLKHALWNIAAILWIEENKKELTKDE